MNEVKQEIHPEAEAEAKFFKILFDHHHHHHTCALIHTSTRVEVGQPKTRLHFEMGNPPPADPLDPFSRLPKIAALANESDRTRNLRRERIQADMKVR